MDKVTAFGPTLDQGSFPKEPFTPPSCLPQIGSLIDGKYETLRVIGEGGMGVVFEVRHVVTHKRFAIKWVPKSLARRQSVAERFIQEARATCAIDHPNVVDVFDVSSDDGAMFLVMELLCGEELGQRMDAGPIDAVECISLLVPVLHGLHEAHHQGIVHRDLKPENIFLSQPRPQMPVVAKLLDFGISKVRRDASAMRLTASGMIMGTAHYMAPEQTQDANVDAQSDVYSFGVILYEALSGTLPFATENLGELLYQIVCEEPPDLLSFAPHLPPKLGKVIMRSLSKDPAKRPQGARGLALELCAALGLPDTLFAPSGAADSVAPPPNPVLTIVPEGRKKVRRRFATLGAACIFALFAVIGSIATDQNAQETRRVELEPVRVVLASDES